MSKKSKPAKQKKANFSRVQRVDNWIAVASQQIYTKDYVGAIETCQRLLGYLPQKSLQRAEVLDYLGVAQSMLQNFPESYEAHTEAISIGQALRDFERAAELNTNPQLTKTFADVIKESRRLAEMALKKRGPDFTLDQLIEQEGYYQRGLKFMQTNNWEEAEQAFRLSIEMRDCMPQPWGNIGICLMMQERYDEAEAALKRALEIDPKYAIAKRNLKILPETRRTGPPKMIGISDPMRSPKLKQGITFVQE